MEDPVPDEGHGLTIVEGSEDSDLDVSLRRFALSSIDRTHIAATPPSNLLDVGGSNTNCIN